MQLQNTIESLYQPKKAKSRLCMFLGESREAHENWGSQP